MSLNSINITGRNFDLTEALRAHVDDKMKRLQEYYDKITRINVILSVEKLSHKAEATLHVPRTELFAEAEADNMYTAIDVMIDKLEKQLSKHKEKESEHR